MPLQALRFKPGVNREGTDYSNEGGWYDCNNVRFRSGLPEKIGGWVRVANGTFKGVCRILWNWISLDGNRNFIGVGTNLKYYILLGGAYNDITPVRRTVTLGGNPFATSYGVLASAMGASDGTLTLVSAAAFPNATGVLLIGAEQIAYSGVSGSTLTGLTRGYNGTTASTHAVGAGVGCSTITTTDSGNGVTANDFVTFSGATTTNAFSAAVLNAEQQVITSLTAGTFTFTVAGYFSTAAVSGGGASVVASYQINTTLPLYQTGAGWGAGGWGGSPIGGGGGGVSTPTGWGSPANNSNIGQQLGLWTNDNFGQDLIIAQREGAIYYWQETLGVSYPAVALKSLANQSTLFSTTASFSSGQNTITLSDVTGLSAGCVITGTGIPSGTAVASSYVGGSTSVPLTASTTASSSGAYTVSYAGGYVPYKTLQIMSSAIQEFVIAFGANPYEPGTPNSTFDPMLVRWSDQANAYQWVPQLTNQSGEYRLLNGSYIMGARHARQEILIWTTSALYSMQYVGAPYVWGFQILMDNITVMSPNCMITVNNVTYWMGREKFYQYSGQVSTLPCSLRQFVFASINTSQAFQVFAGANEGYNEVWWFYCSAGSTKIDSYVIYNYLEQVWSFGTMGRTAWLNAGTLPTPIAANYDSRILYHEVGTDDVSGEAPVPINAFIQSSDFDLADGHNFSFVWRMLPDVNFNNSNVDAPTVTYTLFPRQNSGAAYGTSYVAANVLAVTNTDGYASARTYDIQHFTGQVYCRVRGRQLAFRVESTTLGVAWQNGVARLDLRPDGRR